MVYYTAALLFRYFSVMQNVLLTQPLICTLEFITLKHTVCLLNSKRKSYGELWWVSSSKRADNSQWIIAL